MSHFVGHCDASVISIAMGSQPEEVFRLLHHPERLLDVPFFRTHFANVEALRAAICSFAAGLSEMDSAVLLQCDLGGRGAQEVGREIGLSRRQVQRRRKAVRTEFVRAISSDERPVSISAAAFRSEPAKVTASRLQISVRTLWRERKRLREAAVDESAPGLERALYGSVTDMKRAWLLEDYASALSAVDIAIALADALSRRHFAQCSEIVFDAYGWAEIIERTARDVRLADDLFEKARSAARHCTFASPIDLLSMRELRRDLRDPARYGGVYERGRELSASAPHPLAKLSVAEVLDAWDATTELTCILPIIVRADDSAATRHDVARMRTAVLALCLRPQHDPLARQCIADVRRWATPDSRSGLLATAFEQFLEGRAHADDTALRHLANIAARFRERHLRAETATVLFLLSKALIERGNLRKAGEAIEEGLDAAHGRTSAKLYSDLLAFASSAMGGLHRQRVAAAFAEALTHRR
jgi:hypothetical protein